MLPFSPHHFGAIDWSVVAVYASVILSIGFFYSRGQKTTEEYFTAQGQVSPFMAGISLCASLFSTISYIAVPGEMIQNGPIFAVMYSVALPFTYLAVGWVMIPAIMRRRVTSAYELLQARLGLSSRLLGSVIFVLTRLVVMSLILYTSSRIIVDIMGWPKAWGFYLAAGCGGVTMIYTLFGGIRAVVLTDVIQFFVLFSGAVVTLICITLALGGVAGWWPRHWFKHWAAQPPVSWDPHVRVTMLGTFLGALIWWVCTAGSDQMTIQRYLTTRDARSARRAFLMNNVADVCSTALLSLVGLALIGFFQAHPEALRPGTTMTRNGDSLFPVYISQFLPVGVTGLVVSGLLAGSMSSVSSGINSLIAVVSKDWLETFWPAAGGTEKHKMHTAHILAVVIGFIIVGGSRLIGLVPGNLLEVTFKTCGLFLCPMFGLFFLALFVPFSTPFGAIFSALYSLSAAFIVGYWDLLTGGAGLSFQWIAPVALVVSLSTGVLLSLLPTRGRSRKVQALFALGAVLPLVAVFAWVRR